MSRTRHFIAVHPYRIIYGRVPKAANSAIKQVLADNVRHDPTSNHRVNSDGYWNRATGGDTQMLTPRKALALSDDYFCFSFVRDPVDRAVSCYANKFLRNKGPLPRPLRDNGFAKDMGFAAFVAQLERCEDEDLDVHLRPQAAMLCHAGRLVPRFIGHYEKLEEDWARLRDALAHVEGLELPPELPVKNATGPKFKRPALKELPRHEDRLRARYAEDYRLFYPEA